MTPINPQLPVRKASDRRSFLKKGAAAAGAATVSVALLGENIPGFAQGSGSNGGLTKGDVAILRFLQVLETIEADLWRQYAELGGAGPGHHGVSPIDLPFPNGLAELYITGLLQLDGDMPQYISDNTDDEFSHEAFLKAYLQSKGADSVDLSKFASLKPSQVTGVPAVGRLTNLTQLTVDTSWWTRYRSATMNPDLGDTFPNAIPTLAAGQHTAIPPDQCGPGCRSFQAHGAFRPYAGDREYRGLSLCLHRARREQPVSIIGTESDECGSFAGAAEYWADGDCAFPDLAR